MKISWDKFLWCIGLFAISGFFSVLLYARPKRTIVSRDPFYLEEKKEKPYLRRKKNKKMQRSLVKNIVLEGIVDVGERFAAVINDGKESEVVEVGSRVGDFTVKKIASTVVVLAHGKKTKRLALE